MVSCLVLIIIVFQNVRFLVEKLKTFGKTGNRTSLEVDVQTVDGSFHLKFNDGSGSLTQVPTFSMSHQLLCRCTQM